MANKRIKTRTVDDDPQDTCRRLKGKLSTLTTPTKGESAPELHGDGDHDNEDAVEDDAPESGEDLGGATDHASLPAAGPSPVESAPSSSVGLSAAWLNVFGRS